MSSLNEPQKSGSSVEKLTWWIAIVLLGVFALATRIPQPWRQGIRNDEMHHLESWRNRYRTDDIYPVFLHRLEVTGLVKGRALEWARRIYASGPIAQRGLIILIDPHPPLFPVMAELIEAATHSSLIALRMPSVVASILSILLMYFIGVRLKDPSLGIWLATLMLIGALNQYYGGIGRPYAISQFAILLLVYTFIATIQDNPPTPPKVLLAAIFAQFTLWIAWSLIGPIVLVSLVHFYRTQRSLKTLLRQVWWYVLISILLLPEMVVHSRNPTILGMSAHHFNFWIACIDGSPFLHLASFGKTALQASTFLFCALALCGIGVATADARKSSSSAWITAGLITALVCNLFAMSYKQIEPRYITIYALLPIIFAAVGLRRLLCNPLPSNMTAIATIAIFMVFTFFHPDPPLAHVFSEQTDWETVAADLKAKLKPGDVWISYPYFFANDLYRSHIPTAPQLPQDIREFKSFLVTRPAGASCFVLTEVDDAPILLNDPTFNSGITIDHFGNFMLIRLPPMAKIPM